MGCGYTTRSGSDRLSRWQQRVYDRSWISLRTATPPSGPDGYREPFGVLRLTARFGLKNRRAPSRRIAPLVFDHSAAPEAGSLRYAGSLPLFANQIRTARAAAPSAPYPLGR